MGPAFSIALTMTLAGCLFVPMFLIALAMLRSGTRAFILAGTFSLGATAAGLVSYAVAFTLLSRRHSDDINSVLVALFAVAGAVAGGVLAVFLLSMVTRDPPWRRQ
jgi:ABC-type spermidine/putrescine transport system permease subunit II